MAQLKSLRRPEAAGGRGARAVSSSFQFRQWGTLSDGTVDLVADRLEPADPARRHVPCYHFRISPHGQALPVGRISLRVGRVEDHPDLLTSGHVGYEIEEPHRGHGYAGRACRLLVPVALAHGLDRLVITCAPTNLASRRTLERIGATFVGEFDIPPHHTMYQDGRRRVRRYEWRLNAAA